MATKLQLITEMSERVTHKLTSTYENWTTFLHTAAWNYKYSFAEQVLIYAQRPNAMTCAPIELWNERFNRWVKKGSQGIALIDDSGSKLRLRYVFDISDTNSRGGMPVYIWTMENHYDDMVIEALAGSFGALENKDSLADSLVSAAKNAVEDNFTDYFSELVKIRNDSFLEELDDLNVEVELKRALSSSVAYMLHIRCGIKVDRFFEPDDFFHIFDFNTLPTISLLGNAVSDIAEMALREIGDTIRNLHIEEREARKFAKSKNIVQNERRETITERSDEHGTDVHEEGRLSPARPGTASTAAYREIWDAAQIIPQEQQEGDIHEPATVREADGASGRDRSDSTGTDRTDDRGDGESPERDRDTESSRSDDVDGFDEQPEALGGGNDTGGADLQIEWYDRRTEDRSLPFFHADAVIKEILSSTQHLKASKQEIADFYTVHEDRDERAAYIRSIYNNEHTELLVGENHRVGYKTYQNVLHLWEGEYLSRTSQGYYDWGVIAGYYESMLLFNDLLDEPALPSEEQQIELIEQAESEKASAFSMPQEAIDTILRRGSGIQDGKFRIYQQFQRNASTKENTEFLKNEYGTGGYGPALTGTDIQEWHDSKGVRFTSNKYIGLDSDIMLAWPKVAKRIGELIAADRYLTRKEKQRLPDYESELAERIRHLTEENEARAVLARAPEPSREDAEYSFSLGNTVYLGVDEYEILSIDSNRVVLFDTAFPLFNKEMDREEFDKKVRGNPANNHLIVNSEPLRALPEDPSSNDELTDEFKPQKVNEQTPPPLASLTSNEFSVYNALKEREPDYCIAFRVGDYFELYGEDATEAQGILNSNVLRREIPGVGTVEMTGFCADEWVSNSYRLWRTGRNVALYELDENGGRRLVKRLAAADYIPLGMELSIDDRRFTVDSVDFALDKVSLRDVTFAGATGFPIFRMESVGFVRSYMEEQQPEPSLEELLYGVTAIRDGNTVTIDSADADKAGGYIELDVTLPDEVAKLTPTWEKHGERVVRARFDLLPETPRVERCNFRITNDELGYGGQKTKYAYNTDAIKLLKWLEDENLLANAEEQEILSRYVGWGGIPQAFDENNASWTKEYTELKALLSKEEYMSARESTLSAHYTCPAVIKSIYAAIENMGFKTGNVLEPACGVGNFFGLVPESMKNSKFYGVEIDGITGRIAKQLYQKNSIAIQGFETADMPDSFFDLAIGNVPFGAFGVADKRYDKYKFHIHDYFFAKTLDKVRPGGIVAFITSKGTMDKQNAEVRKYIAQRAELLGAIRLPNNAFTANAGTEVTADILFLQKRDRVIYTEPDWVHLGKTEDGIPINQYFVDNRDMLLGTMTYENSMYGNANDSTCKPYDGADLSEQLRDAISNTHAEITEYEMDVLAEDENASIPADPSVRNFSYTVIGGQIYFRKNSRMNPIEASATAENRIKGMIEIRDCVRTLIEHQIEDYSDEDISREQVRLNRIYDRFTAQYGLLSSRGNNMAFSDDSSYCLLCSLEILNEDGELERKADMFTKRTIRRRSTVTRVDTASEALAVSMAERACVDMGFMQSLTGSSIDELAEQLSGVIFQIPKPKEDLDKPRYVTADEYLSGNVREKLKIAQMAAEVSDVFNSNVKALEAVQPTDLTASEISVRLGATWLPPEIVEQFMYELLGTAWYDRKAIRVHYSTYTAEWNIEGKRRDRSSVKAFTTYGTERINAYKIIEETLNLRDVRIFDVKYDENGNKQYVLNRKETAIAQAKQEVIKSEFSEWIWKDRDRREKLCRLYNDKFNSTRPREYDGSHIQFVGMNPEITLRSHQVNAIARILYGGNTLLAHVVGAGKTFEMVASAMESKRLGLCQKSLFVVPNHLTEQWAAEFLQLYPSANILVATKRDFETKNRKKFCGRIATGDYDAVIIGHSQFEKIPMSIERQKSTLQEELDEIATAVVELKSNRGENYSIKQLERTKKSVKLKLDKLNDQSRKDDVVTFEELGVDRLFIDESHFYKNLFLFTKMRNVGGITQTEAQKSSDLFMKCRYLDELTGGRGIVFATGTPISNSMVELYTVQRYLQYETLRRSGLQHFDAWASTFGETVTAIELAPEGTGYRAKTRFAKFYNLPELMTMFKEVADIQTADMLNLPVPKANYHNVALKPSELQKEMVAELSERADRVRNKMVEPTEDNMLLITNDGRKLALDQRLINPMLSDNENSKASVCAGNVFELWEAHRDKRLTQLVFCDLSTPHYDGSFSVYDDIRHKLIDKGIPAVEIAFIHDANTETKKAELFAKVRSGKVRVLLGSTFKMGAGTNVQDLLVALHDLDCPWRPSDLEQRSGRIVRQGNKNPVVDIFRYVTENTFDAYLYQLVENKQRFIGQIMTSKSPVRSAEDIDETALSYAEIKALATGNPYIKEKMDLDIAVSKLKILKSSHLSQKYALEDQIVKSFPAQIRKLEEMIEGYKADIETVENATLKSDAGEAKFSQMTVMEQKYILKEDAGKAILEASKKMTSPEPLMIGTYRGFELSLSFDTFSKEYKLTLKSALSHTISLSTDTYGNITRMDNALDGLPTRLSACEQLLENARQQIETAKGEVERPFAQEDELKTKAARLAELDALLNMDKKDVEIVDDMPDETVEADVSRIQANAR